METITEFWHGLSSGSLPPLGYWTYLLLAILVAVEGPAATLLGGMLAAAGALHPVAVFLAAGTGNFTADASWYALGRFGHVDHLMDRFPAIRKWRPQINFLKNKMKRHSTKMVLFTKLSMGVAAIPTLIAAGMMRIHWRQLAPASLLAETLWTGTLVISGYYFGEYIGQLEQGLQIAATIGFVVFGLLTLWIYKKLIRQTSLTVDLPPTTKEI